MARNARSSNLETRSARLKLAIAKKPLFVKIGPGVGLGYRRNRATGTWVARVSDGKGGNWTKGIGYADDFDDADGTQVLDFWQAQQKARALARADRSGGSANAAKPATVRQALDTYEADLKTRGADTGNVTRVRTHLSERLLDSAVVLLTLGELRKWRDRLVNTPRPVKPKKPKPPAKAKRSPAEPKADAPPPIPPPLSPATANRTCSALKAALNLAAETDERIVNRRAWEAGLASIRDAETSRNVILAEAAVRQIIAAAQRQSDEFGLLIEVAAVTGARVSQLTQLQVQDVQADREAPRLMMPSSLKGKGKKVVHRRPVPIPKGLAAKLRVLAADRPATAPLLLKPSGDSWKKSDHSRLFARAAKSAGEDPRQVTIYALRHSSIVRQILAGVPIRVVAVNHDTSIAMLERTYSRHIGDHADAWARAALLDIADNKEGNVVPLHAAQ
jgi:integrase